MLRLGIVGLPNVGKSTLFNALTSSKTAAAENYPFCTVDPNVGVVEVPDPRLDQLVELVKPKKKVPAVVEFVDIAGLVKGASQGEGFSERIFVMYAGQIVEKATVERLLNQPCHPYTMALLAGTSEPDANNANTFKEIPPGEPPSLVNPPAGCRFHPRCSKMMAGLCDVKEPPEQQMESNHQVMCWLNNSMFFT